MINPTNQTSTIGVRTEKRLEDHQGDLWAEIIRLFNTMPDETIDGGNDKHFFSTTFFGVKLFVAENEVNGLTVMLPEEY
jgi:hypothetical protein